MSRLTLLFMDLKVMFSINHQAESLKMIVFQIMLSRFLLLLLHTDRQDHLKLRSQSLIYSPFAISPKILLAFCIILCFNYVSFSQNFQIHKSLGYLFLRSQLKKVTENYQTKQEYHLPLHLIFHEEQENCHWNTNKVFELSLLNLHNVKVRLSVHHHLVLK